MVSALRRRRDSVATCRAQLRDLQHPDMGDRTGDQVVEAGEVVGGRRQREARAAGDGAVTDRLESAFTQQLGGRADQRVPTTFTLGGDSTFGHDSRFGATTGWCGDDFRGSPGYLGSDGSLGSHGCSHLGHGASQAGAALPFRANTSGRAAAQRPSAALYDDPHARAESSRRVASGRRRGGRSIRRLRGGPIAPRPTPEATPVSMTGTGIPLAPHPYRWNHHPRRPRRW